MSFKSHSLGTITILCGKLKTIRNKKCKSTIFWFLLHKYCFHYKNSFRVNSYWVWQGFGYFVLVKIILKVWVYDLIIVLHVYPPFQQMCGALAINIVWFFSLFQPTPGLCWHWNLCHTPSPAPPPLIQPRGSTHSIDNVQPLSFLPIRGLYHKVFGLQYDINLVPWQIRH